MSDKVSIIDDVLGPVMHGPSSSHTAASFFIGKLIRNLLDEEPKKITIAFAENGSYSEVYSEQGSDLGFGTGLMGWTITDERFFDSLEYARESGLIINFTTKELKEDNHPNAIEIKGISKQGKSIKVIARSIGGGAVEINYLNGWKVNITGDAYNIIIETIGRNAKTISEILTSENQFLLDHSIEEKNSWTLLKIKSRKAIEKDQIDLIKSSEGVKSVWLTEPIKYPKLGMPLFIDSNGIIKYAEENNCTLGEAALDYEAKLLEICTVELIEEMWQRFKIMESSVEQGLTGKIRGMQLLEPSAQKIFEREEKGTLSMGGPHARAAARALAAMHVNSSMGVVCAAPTGGAAGTIPGVIVTLLEEKCLDKNQIVKALFAAGAIGLILAIRGTFAAEVAGCQVEIGAAGAMSSAAVVESTGGTVKQALDAAAISFQNTMGSPCDLVQGMVEIPCHTRNAIAASSAFVCADLILGGYQNPIPLDETIDAVMEVGKMLPRELRCTALGGLATTPSALALKKRLEL
jgi:L-serine dehydratase